MKKFILYIPIIGVEIYLGFTVILYLFGPYAWPNKRVELYLLLFLYHVSLFLGYMISLINVSKKKVKKIENREISIKKIKLIIFLTLVYSYLSIIRNLRINSFNFFLVLKKIIEALKNPTFQYNLSYEVNLNMFGGKLFSLLLIILSPLTLTAIPLIYMYFRKLNFFWRINAIVAFIMQLLVWLIVGKNKGIFDIAILVSCIVMLNILSDLYYKKNKLKIKKILLICVLFFVAINVFVKNLNERLNQNWDSYLIGGVGVVKSTFLYEICPNFLKPALVHLSGYLSQGYNALNISLDLEWIPTFGFGSSMFIQDYMEKYFNINFDITYQNRLVNFNWFPKLNWHTAYLWFANDVSLIGVSIILLIIGWLLGKSYINSILYKNPYSYLLFSILIMLCFYLPANNQIFSFIENFLSFFLVLFCAVLSKIKRRKNVKKDSQK